MFASYLNPLQIRRAIIRLALIVLAIQTLFWFGDRSNSAVAQQTIGQLVSVSAASYEKAVAPDSIVASFGANLTTITQAANTLPLPNILGNITVEVNGRSAALLFISPAQINYLLPEDLVEGIGQVVVKRSGQIIAAGEIEIRAGAPSIFMANADAKGPPAANLLRVRADNSQVLESVAQFDGARVRFVPRVIDLNAPNDGVFLILYLTGTAKDPQARDYRVLLGGSECRPEFMPYIGIAPGFAGLKQINLNLGACVRKLREENAQATFTGKVSMALADIKNGQTSNVFELEFAPPTGAPLRVTGLNRATSLAGEVLELLGSGLAETSEVYLTDSNGNRFNAQIERPVTPTTVRVRVPFGAGTGTITAVTGRGESTYPLTMRTSVSGIVQLVQRQPDGSDRRIGVRHATVRIVSPIVSAGALTGDDGSFLIPDAAIPNATPGTPIFLNVDGATTGIANLSLKRIDRMIAYAGRDNQFPGYLELRPSTGKNIPVGSNGLLAHEPLRMRASASPQENEYTGQTGEIVFEPNGSTVRYADGSTVSAVTVTALDPGRVPVDLPAGQYSSTIVQLTQFGGQITPGGKLTLPNTDNLPAGSTGALYRYIQIAGNAALGQWVAEGIAQVSADGLRVETGQNAIKETTYYFVSVPRPLTTVYGSVTEADGQPACAAQVQVRGQSGFAQTDANGGFQLRNVPVVGAEMVIEVNYLRADGTVDRTERRNVMPRVGTTFVSPPIVLPGQGQGRAPVLLLPKSLEIEAGKTTDYIFLAYARVVAAILQPPTVTGAPFASITGLNNDRYVLRLMPGTGAVGNYTLKIVASDSQGLRTEEVVALEVKEAVVNVPVAVSQSVTTDEDQAVGITLTGSGGPQYRVINAPQRGVLSGTLPNIIYMPNSDYNGSDNFSFAVGNGSVESVPATVTIAVRPISDTPRLEVGASFTTNIGQLLRVVISGFDPDAGQSLTLTSTALPAGAKIERTTGTSWVLEWRPTSHQIGSYSIDLTLRDDGTPSLSNLKSLTLVVDAIWAQTSGPEGGRVYTFAMNGGTILIGTENGGVFRSTDSGVTWAQFGNGLAGTSVRALAVSGTTVFAGTYAGGMYRTTDNGATWTPINNGMITIFQPDISYQPDIYALAVSGTTVFAGTNDKIFRTTDNGASWTRANNGIPTNSFLVSALMVSGTTVFAGTSDGVYRTADNGNNWTRVSNGLSTVYREVSSLAMSGTTLLAGAYDGVYRSTDNGANWIRISNGLPNFSSIVALAVSGATLFAGNYDGIYRSTNNGASWTLVSNGLTDLTVYSFAVSGATILAGADYVGIYRTTDNGTNWAQSNNGLSSTVVKALMESGTMLFAGTSSAVYRSADRGASWNPINNGMNLGGGFLADDGVRAFAVIGSTIYAGTRGGTYGTTDNGANWTLVLPRDVYSLVVSGTTLFAGILGGAGPDYGIYRSTDNGANWTQVVNGLTQHSPVYALAVSGTSIFAGMWGGGVYRTIDNGANWTKVSNGLTTDYVQTLLVSGTTIYAGASDGVYRTTNSGANWTKVSNGLPNTYVPALAISGTSIFAGIHGGGIYRTTDNGANWTQVNKGVTHNYIRSFLVSGTTLFAGTFGRGVFILAEADLVWSESNQGLVNKNINTAITSGNQVLVGTFEGGVYRSSDSGYNWTLSNTGLPPSSDIRSFTRHNNNLYTGLNGGGIYLSVDDGRTWAVRSNGLSNQQINTLASDGTRLLAGTEGGVYRSTNNGASWSLANTGITRQKILSLLATSSGLYAGTDSGLFRSTDGGDTWIPINTGLTDLYIVSLGVAPNGISLFAGTTRGVYRSTNNGGNWAKVTNGLPENVIALTFTMAGAKFLAGTVYGYYVSEDNGASWRGSSTGLLNLQVSGIAVQGNRVIAGTRSAGVFISQLE